MADDGTVMHEYFGDTDDEDDEPPVSLTTTLLYFLSSGDLHLLKAPSIIKHQAMIKARSRQRHCLLVISGTAVQSYRYSIAK